MNFTSFFRFLVLIILINLGFINCALQIATKYGNLKGTIRTSYKGRNYSSYEGIPYAKPPVGNLRFKEPKIIEPWDGVLSATRNPIICPTILFKNKEPIVEGNEDCLYLNIYVPKMDNNKKLLPIIFYIHGGAYVSGYAQATQPDYLMDQDIILITANYRLGPLGFLSTEDDIIPGNTGLKDQVLALKWVKENIIYFGGDENSVTLFGISAGASSIQHHYLSKWSRGLFHRGFSISGTSTMSFAVKRKSLMRTQKIAATLNCTTSSNDKMVDCLRNSSIEDFMLASLTPYAHVSNYVMPDVLYGPVVENNPEGFLTDTALNCLSKYIYDVPWITSVAKDEGITLTSSYTNADEIPMINDNWLKYGKHILNLNESVPANLQNKVLLKIKQFYFKDENITLKNIDQFVKMMSDRIFFIPAEQAARIQAANTRSPVYLMRFSFVPEHVLKFKNLKPGAAHSTEEQIYFKLSRSPNKLEPQEEMMMEILTKFLANFAQSGVAQIGDVILKPLNPESEFSYYDIISPKNINLVIGQHLGPMKFWTSLPIDDIAHFVSSSSCQNIGSFLFVFCLNVIIF